MTISEHQQNVKTFLNYDFVNGPAQGRILFVDKSECGCHTLREVNVNKLSFPEKMSFFFSDGKKLETVVDYVNDFLVNEARKVQSQNPELWKMQFAQLERKVNKFNDNHWFSDIEFNNPLFDRLKIKVTMPKIPESLDDKRAFKRSMVKIHYTPLTTFEKVEEILKEQIGPERFLYDADSSDRSTIRELAKRKVTIGSWVSNNINKELNVVFKDINLSDYVDYIHEKGYIDGHYKGYASGLYRSSSRTSRRVMTGFPELKSEKASTQKELFEKYS